MLDNPMMSDVIEGRLLIHQFDPKNWRLRNLEKHPIDPNWETGTYSKCHIDFRLNKGLSINTIVFDLIYYRHKILVRSAFIIKEIKNGIVYFNSFLFADEYPLVIPENLYSPKQFRTRYGNKIPKNKAVELLHEMQNHSYNEYAIGTKPKSIKQSEWKKMISIASKNKYEKHICYHQVTSQII